MNVDFGSKDHLFNVDMQSESKGDFFLYTSESDQAPSFEVIQTEGAFFDTSFDNGSAFEADFFDGSKSGNGSGTNDHNVLINRDKKDQHPMSAISGLEKALSEKQPAGKYLIQSDLNKGIELALKEAKESGKFDGAPGEDGIDGRDGTSISHYWEGTILHVTSASGTSSADLKGDPGSGNGGGLYAFEINEDGYLVCHYEDGSTPPAFSINEDGYLVTEI